jgi:predicted  nucleic acid-binding Zn-ribbon protein
MKITIKNCIKRLEKEKDLLAKRRDSIREYLDELSELDENCQSAIEDIECAVDKLSELV